MNQKVLHSFSAPKKGKKGQVSAGSTSSRVASEKSELSLDRQKIVGDFLERLGRFSSPIDVGSSDFEKNGT